MLEESAVNKSYSIYHLLTVSDRKLNSTRFELAENDYLDEDAAAEASSDIELLQVNCNKVAPTFNDIISAIQTKYSKSADFSPRSFRLRLDDIYCDELDNTCSHLIDDYDEACTIYLEVLTPEECKKLPDATRGAGGTRFQAQDRPLDRAVDRSARITVQYECDLCSHTQTETHEPSYIVELTKTQPCSQVPVHEWHEEAEVCKGKLIIKWFEMAKCVYMWKGLRKNSSEIETSFYFRAKDYVPVFSESLTDTNLFDTNKWKWLKLIIKKTNEHRIQTEPEYYKNDCTICKMAMNSPSLVHKLTTCVHQFHIACLRRVKLENKKMKRQQTCPICRRPFYI